MKCSFGDDNVKDSGVRFPKLELKRDEVARMCVISSTFEVAITHWVNRIGYVRCHAKPVDFTDTLAIERDGGRPEECVLCGMALRQDTQELVGLPARRFATYILRYHTDGRGVLLQGQLGYHLEIWLMGNRKFRELMGLQKEWGSLQKYDLELACVDTKYQNFDIALKKEALWIKKKEEVAKYIKEEVVKYSLLDCLGEQIEREVLKRKFEVIRRRNFPDEQVDLGVEAVVDSSGGRGSDNLFEDGQDPFQLGLTGGNLPSVVTEQEKKKVEEDISISSLDELIP